MRGTGGKKGGKKEFTRRVLKTFLGGRRGLGGRENLRDEKKREEELQELGANKQGPPKSDSRRRSRRGLHLGRGADLFEGLGEKDGGGSRNVRSTTYRERLGHHQLKLWSEGRKGDVRDFDSA